MNICLFGELLMRLSPPAKERLVQAHRWDIFFTGGEANAGVVLANLGMRPQLVSAVPDNDLGRACLNYMRRFGLGTRQVQIRGPRLGIFYLEQGASQRPSRVIYDRRGSSFSQLRPGDIDWKGALADQGWLHFCGTAPALSDELAALTLEACQAAHHLGVTVSCDLGYRGRLWSIEKAARVMARIVPHVDVLIANEEQAAQILGVEISSSNADRFEVARYSEQLAALRAKYDLTHAVFTIRSGNTADRTSIASVMDDGISTEMSRRYDIQVVDRIGGGDALAGGLIFGLLSNWDAKMTVEFATAASTLKHTVPGDFAHFTKEEVLELVEVGESGRVQR